MTSTASPVDLVTGRRRGTGLIPYDPDRSAGGYVVWKYVIPQFADYPAGAARSYSPRVHNSVFFKANRYPKARIPWL